MGGLEFLPLAFAVDGVELGVDGFQFPEAFRLFQQAVQFPHAGLPAVHACL